MSNTATATARYLVTVGRNTVRRSTLTDAHVALGQLLNDTAVGTVGTIDLEGHTLTVGRCAGLGWEAI
jgi:hypothetical protein